MLMPLLTGAQVISDGGFLVVKAYRGAKLTIICQGSDTANYSYVDSPDATAHDSDSTVATTEAVTTIDVAWPYIAIDHATGTDDIRIALT